MYEGGDYACPANQYAYYHHIPRGKSASRKDKGELLLFNILGLAFDALGEQGKS